MSNESNKYLTRLNECSLKEEENHARFALNDRGTNNRVVVNADGRHCRKIQIDGALHEVQPNKCDWCLWDYDINEFMFLELKGTDLDHAIKQLGCTISWFLKSIKPIFIYEETYVIVRKNSHIPSTTTGIQIKKAQFFRAFNSVLQVKHSGSQLTFLKNRTK